MTLPVVYSFVGPAIKPGTRWIVLCDQHSVSIFPVMKKQNG
jgi:hypothetical protein